ncbi:MAG: TRAP transporter large permease subunit [Thermodesulfobacteriota bacterium]
MTEWQVGILGVIGLLALMALRMHIGIAMGLVAFIAIAVLNGLDSAFSILAQTPLTQTSSYQMVIIPLFMLMGEFAYVSGLIQDAYKTIYKWVGHLPGGLAMAAIGGCAAFAAVCGSSSATAVVMVAVSLPEMRQRRYWPGLALGSLAAGGTLGILIPPSAAFVLYGIVTEQSIGKLFFSGVLPGILLTLLFWLAIYVQCRWDPRLGPTGPKSSWHDRLVSLKDLWTVAVLFGVVMGGIYSGLFTATEAAGVGVFAAFLLSVARRRFSRASFVTAMLNSLRTTGMVFVMIVGAMMFNYFVTMSGLTHALGAFIGGLSLHPMLIMIAILCLYIFLGCLMDVWAMLLIIVPIVLPIVTDLGFDPIYFGTLTVIMMELGMITPPVGMNVFIMAGMAKEVPMSAIYKGVAPFVIAMVICIALLLAFPQIAMFLPKVLK